MDAALISVPVVKKNRQIYVKTLLLNSNKVKQHFADPADANYTTMYYSRREHGRHKRIEYKVALTVAQFDALLNEPPIEPTVPVYATKRMRWFHQIETINRVIYINLDSWDNAYDCPDGVTAYLWVDEGAWGLTRYTVNHTITQINSRASTSASYSEAGI